MQNENRRVDNTEILNLASREYAACISLYMPEELTGRETRQNLTLYKELCRDAETKLERYSVGRDQIETLLAPLKELEQDEGFWQNRDKGLAIFRGPDILQVHRLPVSFDPLAVVDKHFFIRPLLTTSVPRQIHNVLLLNPEEMRLISFDSGAPQEVTPPDDISSLDEFMRFHEFEEHLEFASSEGPPRGGDTGKPIYHGQGVAGDEAQDNRYLENYYRHVKNWLRDLPQIPGNPLFTVGDSRNVGLFSQEADDLPCRISHLIEKNVKALDPNEILDTVLDQNARLAEDDFEQSTHLLQQISENEPGRVATDAEDILAAAYNHRIDTLFIPANSNAIWGHFNETSQDVTIEQRPEEGVGEELINLAAIKTLQNNGTVIPLADKKRFENVPHFAAICRW